MRRFTTYFLLKNTIYKSIYILIFIIFVFIPVYAQDVPHNNYTGMKEAPSIIKNMQFYDVEAQGETYWGKSAIYEMAALSIIKGRGQGEFDLKAPVTRVQGLAIIYRAMGKEQQAMQAAERLKAQNQQNNQPVNNTETWANGYLVLAAEDELITMEQLNNALYDDPAMLEPEKQFFKTAPAQRQEIAEWMGKMLNLAVDHDIQQSVLNNYTDKDQIDTSKIPYIAAVVKEKLITGYDGFLYPKQGISREEMAQVLKNAEAFILASQALTKQYGVVKEIKNTYGMTDSGGSTIAIIIKDEEGKLQQISLRKEKGMEVAASDQTSSNETAMQEELIVLKEGKLSDSSCLQIADKISYLVDKSRGVRFVEVVETAPLMAQRIYGEEVTGIYKGFIYIYDPYDKKIIVNNLKKWDAGKWVDVKEQAYQEVPVDEDTVIYGESRQVIADDINNNYIDDMVYLVLTKKKNSVAKAAVMSIIKAKSTEEIYDDSVYDVEQNTPGIQGKSKIYELGENATIIKDGQMITENDLDVMDKIYVIAGPMDASGKFIVQIVEVYDKDVSKK